MDDDRADEPERVRLPGFGQPAAHMRPDDARYQPDYGPQPRYSQRGYARERGMITLDDWGYPIIARELPPHLAADAAEAVRLCPRLALRLER